MNSYFKKCSEALSAGTKTKKFALLAMVLAFPTVASAATTGAEFQAVYDFIYNAATGYLGRSIAIAGGLIGLGIGAATGKAIPAIIGIVLAIFGALGPSIVNSIFASAVI
jgi:conjugal transfer pilus assembly protein TraA